MNIPASKLTLQLLPLKLGICKLLPTESLPVWVTTTFFSITKTSDELSLVLPEDIIPLEISAQRGWRVLMIEGPLDFSLTGILASLLNPLAQAKISIFALSTYNTDYILIQEQNLERALTILSTLCTIKVP
jgi:uncharacterized protein